MFNPPHPGRLLRRRVIPSLGLSVTEFAEKLGMSRSSISRVLNGRAAISADLAVRLDRAGIGNSRHWIKIQTSYSLSRAKSVKANHIPRFALLTPDNTK